jgi:hypothetical protein
MSLQVLDPTAEDVAIATTRAAHLTSLQGRTVGLLDNGKIRVRELLDHVEDLLRTEHGTARVIRLKKPDASRPAPPDVIVHMQACDAVISAVGD